MLLLVWREWTIKQFYYINQYIKDGELRVVGDGGVQYGVISKTEAMEKATELEVDLVLVAPNAKPPVAKLIDFAKFKYQQEKKEQTSKKKTSVQETKEIRLTPFMAENDLNTRIKKAQKFLTGNDKVRFSVWFHGRQITRKQFGFDVLKTAMAKLGDLAMVEQEPKFRGKILQMTVKPAKTKSNISNKSNTGNTSDKQASS